MKEGNRWTEIRDKILHRINERLWQPGELIPNEADLALEFGCSRTTVNRALRELASTGIVTRKRKAGTRIALNPPQKATLTIPIIREEVESKGAVYRHKILVCEKRPLPAFLTGAFRVSEFTPLVYTQTMHFADDRPFIYEERYTSLDAVPAFEEADLEAISANEWLVQNAPYSAGDISFFAISATPDVAEMFQAPVSTPLFTTERSTRYHSVPITHARMIYMPGYRMRTQL